MWDLSCKDWEDRIRSGRSLVPTLPLFEREAAEAVGFFDALRLPDVPGTPLLREAAGDWFRDIVAALFGSRDPETNTRHIREVFNLVPKGNSKTTYGAELMMTAMLMNTRPRAEYLFIGPTQAIADLAYSQAVGTVELDRELGKRFQVREHLKEIVDRVTHAKLKIKTFDLDILTGPRPVGVLLDELHLLGKHAAAGKVLRQLRGGLEKSTEGFLVMITTQSDQPPAGVFREELNMARAVRDGRFAGRVLPVLYEFPEDISRPVRANEIPAWYDPDTWKMVMPNLGRSLRLDSLRQDWEAEKVKGDHAIQVWASQHLNIEIGLGLKVDRWRGADHWPSAAKQGLTLEGLIERSEVICIGIDGGGLDDLLGLAVLGRETDTRRWLLWSRAWAHRIVLERRKSEQSVFADLAEAGDLVIVDDMEVAFAELAEIAERIDAEGLLASVGLDPMGVGAIVDALADRGIEGDDRVRGVQQGWTLNGAIKTAEIKLANGTLQHCGQKLMDYALQNAKIEPKGNAITITKQTSGAGKIDPLMAMFDAVVLMSRNPEALRSVYASHGLLVI
jgi:phage terminase large subunit-like protein